MIAGLALVALLLAMPAAAQDGTVQIRTRAPAPGDVYRFESRTAFEQSDDQGVQTQTNRIEFTLEVLGTGREGLRLRQTVQAVEIKDSGGAGMEAALKAVVGASLDFRVSPQGRPIGVDNWDAYRARVLARIDAALPPTDPVRRLVQERYGQPPLVAAQELALSDAVIMATMEPSGAVPLGRSSLVDPDSRATTRATIEATITQPGCRVRIDRESLRSLSGVSNSIVSTAEVSVIDGRVLVLEERRVTRAPRGNQMETVQIRR
ncbi:MAG: hypothetical protein ACK53I_16855, partial [Phenylobacterium sp.]